MINAIKCRFLIFNAQLVILFHLLNMTPFLSLLVDELFSGMEEIGNYPLCERVQLRGRWSTLVAPKGQENWRARVRATHNVVSVKETNRGTRES